MEINDKVFRKYNPQEDVVRCPYGRAKVRDSLHDYALAAVNLYGVIPLEDLVEIFNEQTEYETDADELYIMLLPMVFKDEFYVFYKNTIAEYSTRYAFEKADALLEDQAGKPRYIPEKDEFLKYLNGYYDDNHFRAQLIRELRKKNVHFSEIDELYIQLQTAPGVNEGLEIINNYGLAFDSKDEMEDFVDIYIDWHNNRRLLEHKGHRPTDLIELMAESEEESSEEVPEILSPKDIGRNDPCPCGRGKKFKKCCLKYDRKKTAQLSAQDKKLFFEIYLSLMNFVNQKNRIVNFTFDPQNSEANPQQLTLPVRQLLVERPQLISEYLKVTDLSADKKEILASWQDHYVEKNYMIVDYQDDYAILMDIEKEGESKIYGVKGISHSIATAVLQPLPVSVTTVLLPFKDYLIYDSFLGVEHISYGSNISREVAKTYQNIMDKEGIVSRKAT